jgi:hypothetical protein
MLPPLGFGKKQEFQSFTADITNIQPDHIKDNRSVYLFCCPGILVLIRNLFFV